MVDDPSLLQAGWKCPITGECSMRKIHRRCTHCVIRFGNTHCWDCCGDGDPEGDSCKCFCPEPSLDSIDYDMPPGETLT